MFNMMKDIEMCTNQSNRALRALKTSYMLKPFFNDKTMILPESTNSPCFKIKMPVGTNELIVSFAFAPDRQGNQGTSAKNPPSMMEIFLLNVPDEFYTTLDYNGDIRSFEWDQSNAGVDDDGFEEIIDELIRIRNILNAQVKNKMDDGENIFQKLCEYNDSILELKNELSQEVKKQKESKQKIDDLEKKLNEYSKLLKDTKQKATWI